MIAGIKTAAEARADALAWQSILDAPNSLGTKIMSRLSDLMIQQAENPTALFFNVPGDVRIPTAAIAQIQVTWGYVITATSGVGKPPGYTGNITNWSRITKISWE